MTEPVYEYRKGVGWVPTINEEHSAIIGRYRVTCIDRKPEVGEYYFSDPYGAASTLDALQRVDLPWTDYFTKHGPEDIGRYMYLCTNTTKLHGRPVTVNLEYLG